MLKRMGNIVLRTCPWDLGVLCNDKLIKLTRTLIRFQHEQWDPRGQPRFDFHQTIHEEHWFGFLYGLTIFLHGGLGVL